VQVIQFLDVPAVQAVVPAVLAELVALHRDAVRRAGKCLQVRGREAPILQPQGAQRPEAEDVADDGGQQVDDRALFEQVQGVGDAGGTLRQAAARASRASTMGLRSPAIRRSMIPGQSPPCRPVSTLEILIANSGSFPARRLSQVHPPVRSRRQRLCSRMIRNSGVATKHAAMAPRSKHAASHQVADPDVTALPEYGVAVR